MWFCPLPQLAPGMVESMALRGGGYSMAPCPRVQDETMANMSSRTKSAMAALMMARRVRMAGVWGRCAAGWTPETAAAVDAELPRWSPAGTGGYPEGWQQEEGVRARAADELRAGAVGVKMGMTHTYSGSHYNMAGSRQYQKGVRVKGTVLRHSKQGAKMQAQRQKNKQNRGNASVAVLQGKRGHS